MGRWLVTSAWPYINYVPHLGTIIGSVLSADVFARFLRMRGEEVLFVSGSDEHGTPIEVEAIRQGVHPKQLTDRNHEIVKELFERWGISFDNYTRTESETHKRFVQRLCRRIYENGYVFSRPVVMPYCANCARFLPDRFIQGTCPLCGSPDARGDQCDSCGWLLEPSKLLAPTCAICGSEPARRETVHWFFDLPKCAGEVLAYVESNEQLPDNARNFTLKLIGEGLKPRALTRDNQWGIEAPFPGSEGKTIYVWFEAVLGYVSAAMEHFERRGEPDGWKRFWMSPDARTLFFVGKDNIPFHTIILPALLLASGEGYNLPWNVNSTEFLMFEGQKFSKSRRVGVWIDEALDLFPVDYWRYVLLAMRPEAHDTSFTWDLFLEKVNSDLNDTLGNFIHRTLTFINRHFASTVPEPRGLTDVDVAMLEAIRASRRQVEESLGRFRFQAAVGAVMELARRGNRYINDKAPWKAIKEHPNHAATTLYVAVQVVKALAVLLAPFIPFTSDRVLQMLRIHKSGGQLSWADAEEELKPGSRIGEAQPLFRKVEPKELDAFRSRRETPEAKPSPIDLAEFSKADIRVGVIVEAEPVPNSDKLYRLSVDVGEEKPKTVVAGLRPHYGVEELKGAAVALVVNLKPQRIFGIASEAMLLVAEDGQQVALLQPQRRVKPGSRVR